MRELHILTLESSNAHSWLIQPMKETSLDFIYHKLFNQILCSHLSHSVEVNAAHAFTSVGKTKEGVVTDEAKTQCNP